MPANYNEVLEIKKVVDGFLPEEKSSELFHKLYHEIGLKSSNESFKLSMLMLHILFQTGLTFEQKALKLKEAFSTYPFHFFMPKKTVNQSLLIGIVLLHFFVIFGLIGSLFTLPGKVEWYIWLPLVVFIVNTLLTPGECIMTKVENKLRRSLGLNEIRGFIKTYFVKPYVKLKLKLGISNAK